MSYFDDVKAVAKLDLPWEKLRGCNVLITGATGLIGSCLVDILMSRSDKDYHVYASGRNEEVARKRFKSFFNDTHFHFFKYDVLSPMKIDIEFQFIIHAASYASPNSFVSKPVEVIKANIIGTCNLLDYGIKHNIQRFLYISSGEIYGEGDGCAFEEDYSGYVNLLNPRSCYPSGKRAAETLCVSYAAEYGIEIVIARPCHTYGPFFLDSDNRVYAQFIRNVLKGEDIVMKSSGEQFRSWCYVVDCASALLYILLKGDNGKAYNIADDSSNITIKELAELVADLSGRKVVIDLPSKDEKDSFNEVKKSVFVTDKLQSLGWCIKGNMKDKMCSTIKDRLKASNLDAYDSTSGARIRDIKFLR